MLGKHRFGHVTRLNPQGVQCTDLACGAAAASIDEEVFQRGAMGVVQPRNHVTSPVRNGVCWQPFLWGTVTPLDSE